MTRIRTILVAAAVMGTSTLALAAPYANASGNGVNGSNGQQIKFCVSSRNVTNGFATANGLNQDSITTSSPPVQLGDVGQCTTLPRWWWKGQVTINWSNATGHYIETTMCHIPPSQGSNWTKCHS